MGDWMAELRTVMERMGDEAEDWQGRPVPIEDFPVRLARGHPLADKYAAFHASADPEPPVSDVEDPEQVVNHWFSYKAHQDVWVCRRGGRSYAVTSPRSPDSCMDRLTFWLRTVAAADAWELEAEFKAREKLAGMLSGRAFRQYELTGAFFETSKRSRLTYVFRRLRPTVVLSPRWGYGKEHIDLMRVLAVLCLHPVGYYEGTWAGCMVPTDDVIAHLLLARGDEPGFWKQATQHRQWEPEAGL